MPSPTTAEDLVAATRRTYAGPLAVGYDLMTIVIGDTVDVFPRKTHVGQVAGAAGLHRSV